MMSIFLADYLKDKNMRYSVLVVWMLQMAGLFAFVCPLLLKWVHGLEIEADRRKEKKPIRCFLIQFAVSLGFLLVFYAAYYPGVYSADPMWQYEQAMTGVYNDWHPVLHTLFSFKVPLVLTGGWPGSVVLFQMIELALAIAYASATVYACTNLKTSVAVFCCMAFSPVTGSIALNPWKDVAVAITALLLMAMAFHIHMTNGEWLGSIQKAFILSALLAAMTLLRHNAILFTAPLLLALCLYIGKRRAAQVLGLFLAVMLLVKGPVYSLLNVEKPGSRQIEILGLPMTVIGNVVKEEPEALDEELKAFVYAIAPQDAWETYYQRGDFNQIKWQEGVNLEAIEEAGAARVILLMLKACMRAPGAALRGLLDLIDMVYSVDGRIHWWPQYGIAENTYGIVRSGAPAFVQFVSDYVEAATGILRYVFWSIGMMNLIVIVCILAKTRLACMQDIKRMLLAIPVLIYNFGTMLLLTGPDFRFFYFSFVTMPIIVVLMLSRENSDPENTHEKGANR